ncbi:hypothetical protein ACFH04_06620 [Streptomyces noboritoensis]|uniref:Secreted protein n=1 Tax=Streptomyces noboritoensis TaxID=67337 RepID=A0ABV6TCA6_9ACTN
MAAVAGVGLWLAPAAAAVDSDSKLGGCGPFGQSICGHGGVSNNNLRAYACDSYADGDGFMTIFWLASGESGTVYDHNGSQSGCGEYWVTGPYRITSYQACSNTAPPICRPRVWV